MREISEIIIHCSATFAEQKITVDDIRRWHRQLGWKDVGYHYLIDQQGKVHDGRPIESEGAHCVNHNAHSIGICYFGGLDVDGKPSDTRTDAQKASLVALVRQLKEQYPKASVHGHNEYSSKACPCFDVQQWKKENNI